MQCFGVLVVFCAMTVLSLLCVYAACYGLIFLGLREWVFTVWLIGVPTGFVGPIAGTVFMSRKLWTP
jgi:hypothetical protein